MLYSTGGILAKSVPLFGEVLRDLSDGVPLCEVCVESADKGVARGHSKEGGLRVSGDIGAMVYRRPVGPRLM
jgi:hypothetical protein